MANVQLQRTLKAEAVTTNAIDQKQSLEVVQTMLHGGLSTLAYLRNFFNDKVFDRQLYEMSEMIRSYDDYAGGRLNKDRWAATDEFTVMKILRRGRSKRADMLLDWLENGAFIALKEGTLQALNIYVHPEPTNRKKVIEQYTFTVKYLPGAEEGEMMAGLEVNGDGFTPVSVGATNAALQSLLQQMMKHCGVLPNLPAADADQRFVSMELFYRQDSRPAKLKGWAPSTSDSLYFAESNNWEKRVRHAHELQSGFHRASFKLSYLCPASQEEDEMFDDLKPPPTFPKSLTYNTRSSKQGGLEQMKSEERVTEVPNEASIAAAKDPNSNTPSTVVESGGNRTPPMLSQVGIGSKSELSTSASVARPFDQTSSQTINTHVASGALSQPIHHAPLNVNKRTNTQSSKIPEMTDRLEAMLQPEYLTQGDTQTQEVLRDHDARTHQPFSQLHGKSGPERSNGTTQPGKKTEPTLRQQTLGRLEENRKQLCSTAYKFANVEGSKQKDGELVRCQCDCLDDEGAMVCCVYCNTWQHLLCYGYTGLSDHRLPQNHVCYQCLLGDREEGTMKMLRDLVQKRRGMHLAINDGLTNQRAFAKDMGLPSSVAGPLFQHLRKQGYVRDAKGSRKAGYAASGKPNLVAVQDGPNHEKMLRNLFDPIMYIGHHFERTRVESPKPTASLTQQLLAGQKNNMPPPVTPASKVRKKYQTPGSSLDLRASMTPLDTPTHVHSRQPQPSKRARAEHENEGLPPKRRASTESGKNRLKSVCTTFMVDTSDISPAPVWINGSDYILQSSDSPR